MLGHRDGLRPSGLSVWEPGPGRPAPGGLPCSLDEGGGWGSSLSSGRLPGEPVSRAWLAEQALARPARLCGLTFPHPLVFSSPLPPALPDLWPSPHPPGTGSHRGGVLERGLGRGCCPCSGSTSGGQAVRVLCSPGPGMRSRSAFSCPACPRLWL